MNSRSRNSNTPNNIFDLLNDNPRSRQTHDFYNILDLSNYIEFGDLDNDDIITYSPLLVSSWALDPVLELLTSNPNVTRVNLLDLSSMVTNYNIENLIKTLEELLAQSNNRIPSFPACLEIFINDPSLNLAHVNRVDQLVKHINHAVNAKRASHVGEATPMELAELDDTLLPFLGSELDDTLLPFLGSEQDDTLLPFLGSEQDDTLLPFLGSADDNTLQPHNNNNSSLASFGVFFHPHADLAHEQYPFGMDNDQQKENDGNAPNFRFDLNN